LITGLLTSTFMIIPCVSIFLSTASKAISWLLLFLLQSCVLSYLL
jgi:hypothetical protein